jgi:TraG P-loop domain
LVLAHLEPPATLAQAGRAMTEVARTVGAVDVEPTLPLGHLRVPQDAVWGVSAGLVLGVVLALALPGWFKVLGSVVLLLQVSITLLRSERVSGWKLVAAWAIRGRLPNKIDAGGRYKESSQLLPGGIRQVLSSRKVVESGQFAIPEGALAVGDGFIRSRDRGCMAVFRYTPPSDHWGAEAHARWAKQFVNALRQAGGSVQLWTRIRKLDAEALRAEQAKAISEAVRQSRSPVPATMVEAELKHVEDLAHEMVVVDHFLVIHPHRDGLWLPRWTNPGQASQEEADEIARQILRSFSGSGLRLWRATRAEIESALAVGINGGQEAFADYSRGGVSVAEGERRMIALSRPPRQMLPGSLMESCGTRLGAQTVVITTRLAPVPEHEAVLELKKVARDYNDTVRSGKTDEVEQIAAETAVADAKAMVQEIFLERATSWRWQTLIEFTAPADDADSLTKKLVTELMEAQWRPQVLRLWPLHTHAAMSLGGGALKRFQHLMPSLATAFSLPVMGVPFSNPSAPLLGRNELTGTPVSLDLTREHSGQPGSAANRNMSLVGPTGSGKTTTLGVVMAGLASRGQGLLVLDYASEMGHLIRAYGGESVELADRALNPFGVAGPQMSLEQRELLKEAIGILGADNLPSGRRGLRPEEESWLSEVLDWFVSTWTSEHSSPPLLEDFISMVNAERRRPGHHLPVIGEDTANNLMLRLKTWTQGRKGLTFNRPSNLDLSGQRLLCLGMRRLRSSVSTDNLWGPIAIVMSAFYQELTKYGPNDGWRGGRGYTMHLVVDEAHLAFDDAMLGPALERYSREVRKFGGSVIGASQALEDYLRIRYSRVFLENCGTKLFLGVASNTRAEVQRVAGLEDWEMDFLVRRAERGFGMLIAGHERSLTQVAPHAEVLRKLMEAEHLSEVA